MKTYTPRRASLKRWLEGAPEYVLDCFDDPTEPGERYTVFFGKQFMCHLPGYPGGDYWLSYIGMSENPSHPQGIGLSGEMSHLKVTAYRYRNRHRRVRWQDLPEAVRQCVKNWAELD